MKKGVDEERSRRSLIQGHGRCPLSVRGGWRPHVEVAALVSYRPLASLFHALATRGGPATLRRSRIVSAQQSDRYGRTLGCTAFAGLLREWCSPKIREQNGRRREAAAASAAERCSADCIQSRALDGISHAIDATNQSRQRSGCGHSRWTVATSCASGRTRAVRSPAATARRVGTARWRSLPLCQAAVATTRSPPRPTGAACACWSWAAAAGSSHSRSRVEARTSSRRSAPSRCPCSRRT